MEYWQWVVFWVIQGILIVNSLLVFYKAGKLGKEVGSAFVSFLINLALGFGIWFLFQGGR